MPAFSEVERAVPARCSPSPAPHTQISPAQPVSTIAQTHIRVSFPVIMVKGQRVVCINDTFNEFIRAIYKQLPVKGVTYTIREVFLGREKVVKGGDSATVGLLLVELNNPPDPFHAGKQELGFTSERFAPLEEIPAEEAVAENEDELVGAGGKKGAGFLYGNN
jgi:hypothetical protein